MKRFCLAIAAIAAAACSAPTTADVANTLQNLTASTMPGADAARIRVEDARRSAAKWEWRAHIDGKSFQCDSDNTFRLPSCTALES
jgi:hypothetical protein